MPKLDLAKATKGLTNEEIRRCVTMATYKYFGSVFDAALGEYGELGFSLHKTSDNIVELHFKDKNIGTFYYDKVTIEIIREGCKNYMASLARSS